MEFKIIRTMDYPITEYGFVEKGRPGWSSYSTVTLNTIEDVIDLYKKVGCRLIFDENYYGDEGEPPYQIEIYDNYRE